MMMSTEDATRKCEDVALSLDRRNDTPSVKYMCALYSSIPGPRNIMQMTL